MGKKTKDLTVGSPFKLILQFTIPIFFGIIFQHFYGMVDTMIVGKTLGVDELAAVGATGSITFMVIGMCNGIASGFAIPVAQRFGAKDEKGLKAFIFNGITLGLLISVLVSAFVSYFCMDILRLMNTPENIIQYTYDYLIVIFWGIPVTFFFNLFSGFMRSLGDSKTPVVVLSIGCLFNIVLDYILIVYVNMGVAGAGYATVIAQIVSTVVIIFMLWKEFPMAHLSKDDMNLRWNLQTQLCFVGIPMGIQTSLTALGNVFLQTAINGLGSDYVAAVTSACRIALFALAMTDALAVSMATYSGQNIGAKNLDRVSSGVKAGSVIGVTYAVIAWIIVSVFGEQFALLFVNSNETLIIYNMGLYLRTESGFYFVLALIACIRSTIQGMGYSGLAVFSGMIEMVVRILVALFLIPAVGFLGAGLASPIAWVTAIAFLIPVYIHVMKKVRKKLEMETV